MDTSRIDLHLFGYFRSSAAYRCRIAFNLKGIACDFTAIHLRRGGGEQHSPTYLGVNPQGLVPALRLADGEVLTQSLAIIEWLDETHREPALLPADALSKAKVRAVALAIACDIHPLHNLRVLRELKSRFGADQEVLDDWCRRWVGSGLEACEALLANERAGPFCFGGQPGLADICLVPQMSAARRFGCDLARIPRLLDIDAACRALPAFASADPSLQPDAEP